MTTNTSISFDRYAGSPADIYERYFVPAIGRPMAEPVIDAARLQPGDRVLDVACGTGIAARLAAGVVGSTGTVVGIDGNPDMLATARTAVPADLDIEWRQASADDLPFPDATFDAVVCSLGLQFFADKAGALSEMRRVVTSTGRISLGVPGPSPAAMVDLHDVLASHIGTDVATFVETVFSLHDPTEIRALADRADLANVNIHSQPLSLRLAPPAEFLWQYMRGTPLAAAAVQLDDDQRAAIEREIVERWQRFTTDDGMALDVGLTVATATPPPRQEKNQ